MNTYNQNLSIEIETKGRNTIPFIDFGNIITIHGKNGVGKSMAGNLLEIASGNYTFESENRFKKLASVIEECKIQYKDGHDLLFKVILKPLLWSFDKNLNRINPLSLGNYYKGDQGKEIVIDFTEFGKSVNVRTIRGNESLEQQVYFFKDIFIAKISQKLEKLVKKIEYLENYQNQIKKDNIENVIHDYYKIREEFNELLNQISNYKNSLTNREANLNNFKKNLNLLERLLFISENDIKTIIEKKKEETEKVEKIRKEVEAKYKERSNIKTKLVELETRFDIMSKKNLKKLSNLRKKKEQLKNQLISQYKMDLSTLEENSYQQISEVQKKIKVYEDKINSDKKSIEKLNKQNKRIIEINKYLTQLRDTCSKASSQDFGKEKLIKTKFDKKNELMLSFQEFFEIFHNNNIEFKQDKELKEYHSIIQNYNEEINSSRKKLSILEEYDKVVGKITQLLKELSNKGSNIDDFVAVDDKIGNLKQKQQENITTLQNLEKLILEYNQNLQDLTKIVKDLELNPSKTSLISELNKSGIKITQNETITEQCKQNISGTEKKISQSEAELIKMQHDKDAIQGKYEKTKKEFDVISKNIQEAAKTFGYTKVGEFIDYYKPHLEKFNEYLNNTINLHSRLKILKDDIGKVIEGGKPKNKVHTKIINDEFDEIFKKIYGRKEFFEYVFKDYSRIKKFDIINKTIIFETTAGLEETRDLEEFSSGEKTYAYCRSIISMNANVAKFNILILDESYALLDSDHSENLYSFQEQMIKEKNISKFINILPFKDIFKDLIPILEKNLKEADKSDSENSELIKSQLDITKSFQKEVSKRGYYQEIHYPLKNRRVLGMSYGIKQDYGSQSVSKELEDEDLAFSFILDGSNIARNNRNTKNASIRDVIRCKEKLKKFGVPEKNIFIVFGAGLRHHIPERDNPTYELLLKDRTVNQAPAGRDDDWFIIKYAMDHDSYIITNDRYLDYRKKSHSHETFIKTHSIRYSVIGNDIIFEDGFNNKLKAIISQVH